MAPVIALSLGLLIGRLFPPASSMIEQHLCGPISAPIINYVHIDQKADVDAQVQR